MRGALSGSVLVASPTASLRRLWANALRESFHVHEAPDLTALERRASGSSPDVIFLDAALPGLGGLGGVPGLRRLCPDSRIVFLTGAPDEQEAVFALVAGGRGYCDRRIEPSMIRKAAEVVQRGEIWIGRHIVPHLLSHLVSLGKAPARITRPSSAGAFEFLAPREREIALLVGDGARNREIARQLSITEATVKAHLTSVFRKLSVSDRLRLALIVTGRAGRRARRVRSRATGMSPRRLGRLSQGPALTPIGPADTQTEKDFSQSDEGRENLLPRESRRRV